MVTPAWRCLRLLLFWDQALFVLLVWLYLLRTLCDSAHRDLAIHNTTNNTTAGHHVHPSPARSSAESPMIQTNHHQRGHLEQVSKQEALVTPFMALFASQRAICSTALTALFAAAAPTTLASAVFTVQQFITLRLYCQRALDKAVAAAADLLKVLNAANERAVCPISYEAFYNDVVNSADFDVAEDWRRFVSHPVANGGAPFLRGVLFSFCRYAAPFHWLFLPASGQRFQDSACALQCEDSVSR
jgi:hypothetical protein